MKVSLKGCISHSYHPPRCPVSVDLSDTVLKETAQPKALLKTFIKFQSNLIQSLLKQRILLAILKSLPGNDLDDMRLKLQSLTL